MEFTARPLVPIAVSFALGILAGQSRVLASTLCAASLVVLAASFRVSACPLRLAVLLLIIAAAGALRALGTAGPASDDISHFATGGYFTVGGSVCSDAERRGAAWACEIAVERVSLPNGRTVSCGGNLEARLAGSEAVVPEYGDRIEARGRLDPVREQSNSGGMDYAAYLSHRGVFATLTSRRQQTWHVASNIGLASLVPRLGGTVRRSILRCFEQILPRAQAGLLAGILIGARSALPPELDDDFAATGLVHVLATAGLHVGLVAWLIHAACRALRFSRPRSAGLTMALLLVYAVAAGGRPSVVRAVLMTEIYLLGFLIDRDADGPNSLSAAALALLALNPASLYDAGFQLTFATVATFFAVLRAARPMLARIQRAESGLARPAERRARFAVRRAMEICTLTIASQIGSAPLVAQYFNEVSLVGLPANLLVVPALAPVMASGFATWLLSFVWMGGARLVGGVLLSPLLDYTIGVAQTCAGLPHAAISVPSPGWILIALYYGGLGILLHRIASRRRQSTAVVMSVETPLPEEAAAR